MHWNTLEVRAVRENEISVKFQASLSETSKDADHLLLSE
jgi:hypothetical protein